LVQKCRSIFEASVSLLAVLVVALLVDLSQAEADPSDADSITQLQKVIVAGVTRNWIAPSEAPAVCPRIRVRLNRDGSLDGSPEIENPSDDPAFKAYADSALRAIYRAAPFDLARHGETEWTISRQHTGCIDIPLTARGEQEARRLASRLGRAGLGGP
jgi:hypothetical protein